MLHLIPPTNRRLVWYLAMEEYFAKQVQEDIFFTWVVSPTVIFGRHQVMEAEVNMDFCRANGIAMYRRKSGGGCVYADEGNLMMSLISPSTHSEEVFQSFLDKVSGVLRDAGFAAVKSEHNDIMVEGYKVSGNACYALPTGTIVHGTLLVQVDFEMLHQEIVMRDKQDTEREHSPLVCAEDAVVVDTSEMSIEQVVTTIKSYIQSKI